MLFTIFFALVAISAVDAEFDLGIGDDSDLFNFVTRPELRAPRFNVTVYDANRVTPGYWFVAPYASIVQQTQPKRYYQACQTGPAIYDGAGNLVWSGACEFRNQNTCDFRPFRSNGSDHLSAILYGWELDRKGRGIIMDSSYEVSHSINVPRAERSMNMHEMQMANDGKTAMYIIHKSDWVDISELSPFGIQEEAGWVFNIGFREVEIDTGKALFEWWALDHVPLSTSSVEIDGLDGPPPAGWNFFHMNSVDKNADGDYMISARYTDCIYKISGTDGHIIWRLGGDESSFALDAFNFSKQHDARFIEQNATTTVISFLDNASDGVNNVTSDVSTSYLVALETSVTPMVARVIRRWSRPDGHLSHARGNFQLLPNGNAFTAWSGNAYITEHAFDGDLVMEAGFASERFVTYRSYKHNFTGHPSEPPTLKAYAYGTSPATSTTVCYVSWNGATEVDSWDFYRNNSASEPIGRAQKTGFETMFQATGYYPDVYAQAISASGQVLGRSSVQLTVKSQDWQSQHTYKSQNVLSGLLTSEWPLLKSYGL
ncbi:hypothetical protein LTR85_001030 [Meristemomyces frigidus]|nr:hypothetical protein LTR85_001030 [Meristemomyces frigidus]